MKKLVGIFAALTLSTAAAWAAPTVELQTSMGKIVVELDAQKAPKSAANFLQYAKDGFYNGTIFHRVIPGFMIQGGGFDAKMNKKATREPIDNEAKNGLKNQRGTLAMARTGDPHSATALPDPAGPTARARPQARSPDARQTLAVGEVIVVE